MWEILKHRTVSKDSLDPLVKFSLLFFLNTEKELNNNFGKESKLCLFPKDFNDLSSRHCYNM